MKSLKAESVLFLMTIIWGGTFVATKIGLEYCSFSLYIMIRFAIALLLSLMFFGKYLKNIDRETLKHGVILGLIFGGGFVFQTIGLKYTEVSNSAFITGFTVPLTPLISWLIQKKKIPIFSILACIFAFVGLIIFTNPFGNQFNYGDLITLFSTLFWAFYITYMDVFTKGKSGIKYTGLMLITQLAAALLVASLVFLITEIDSYVFILNNNLIISLLYNAILASFLVTLLHTGFQKYSTPVKAALIFSLEPIFATIFSAFLGLELIGTLKIIGGTIMMIGILTSELAPIIFRKTINGN